MKLNKIILFWLVGVVMNGLSMTGAHSNSCSKFTMDETDREIQDFKMAFPDEVLMEELEPERQIFLNDVEEYFVHLSDRFYLDNSLLQKLLNLQKYGTGEKNPSQVSHVFANKSLEKCIEIMKSSCNIEIFMMDQLDMLNEMFIKKPLLKCFSVCIYSRLSYLETRYLNLFNYANRNGQHYPLTIEKEVKKQCLLDQMQARDSIFIFEHMSKLIKDLCCALDKRGESALYIPLLEKYPVLKKYILNETTSPPRPDNSYDDCKDYISNNFTTCLFYENGMEKTKLYHNDDLPKFYKDQSQKNNTVIESTNKDGKGVSKALLRREEKRYRKEVRARQVSDSKQSELKFQSDALKRREEEQKNRRANNNPNPQKTQTINNSHIINNSPTINNSQPMQSDESNELCIISSSKPEKYVPPCIRVKVKTRGVSNPANEKDIESSSEEEQIQLPDIIVHGSIWSLICDFWEKKSGFTYEDFKTLFIKLGGAIDESTGSTHMVLIYTNEKGETIKGGIWKYHYPVTAFGYSSMKMLKEYMEKCGLTLDRIRGIEV